MLPAPIIKYDYHHTRMVLFPMSFFPCRKGYRHSRTEPIYIFMRPSSLGGGRILRRTLSVRLSVCLSLRLSVRPVIVYIRTVLRANIQNRKTSVFAYGPASRRCTFRHAQRAAYRTAISAAQTCLSKENNTRPCKPLGYSLK